MLTDQQSESLAALVTSRHFHIPAVLIAAVMALVFLAALWATKSRAPWFWRALALWSAAAIWIPIEAYEMFWFFGGTSLTLAAIVCLGGLKRHGANDEAAPERRTSRYTLMGLLKTMLLIALWLAIVVPAARAYPPTKPWLWAIVCLSFAMLAKVCYWAAAGPKRWLAVPVLVFAICLTTAAVAFSTDHFRALSLLNWTLLSDESWLLYNSIQLGIVLIEMSLGVVLAIVLARALASSSRRWLRVCCAVLLVALLAAAAWPLGRLYVAMIRPAPAVAPYRSTTNHYRRVCEICKDLRRLNGKELALDELVKAAGGVATARAVDDRYKELFVLLEAPNHVDYDPARDAIEDYDWYNDIYAARGVVRMLRTEGRAALRKGDRRRFIDCSIAIIRLSRAFRNGGLISDFSSSWTLTILGYAELARERENFSPEESRKLIGVLVHAIDGNEPISVIEARDRHHMKRVLRWEAVWTKQVQEWCEPRHHSDSWAHEIADRWSTSANVLLQTELAIRLYRADRGRWPNSLAELTSGYLRNQLSDPHCGRPLNYRAASDRFVVYSVGWDGVDDGGAFKSADEYSQSSVANMPGLDLDLESCIWSD